MAERVGFEPTVQFPDDANEPMELRGMDAVYVKATDGPPASI
jgi:hypothetical protein